MKKFQSPVALNEKIAELKAGGINLVHVVTDASKKTVNWSKQSATELSHWLRAPHQYIEENSRQITERLQPPSKNHTVTDKILDLHTSLPELIATTLSSIYGAKGVYDVLIHHQNLGQSFIPATLLLTGTLLTANIIRKKSLVKAVMYSTAPSLPKKLFNRATRRELPEIKYRDEIKDLHERQVSQALSELNLEVLPPNTVELLSNDMNLLAITAEWVKDKIRNPSDENDKLNRHIHLLYRMTLKASILRKLLEEEIITPEQLVSITQSINTEAERLPTSLRAMDTQSISRNLPTIAKWGAILTTATGFLQAVQGIGLTYLMLKYHSPLAKAMLAYEGFAVGTHVLPSLVGTIRGIGAGILYYYKISKPINHELETKAKLKTSTRVAVLTALPFVGSFLGPLAFSKESIGTALREAPIQNIWRAFTSPARTFFSFEATAKRPIDYIPKIITDDMQEATQEKRDVPTIKRSLKTPPYRFTLNIPEGWIIEDPHISRTDNGEEDLRLNLIQTVYKASGFIEDGKENVARERNELDPWGGPNSLSYMATVVLVSPEGVKLKVPVGSVRRIKGIDITQRTRILPAIDFVLKHYHKNGDSKRQKPTREEVYKIAMNLGFTSLLPTQVSFLIEHAEVLTDPQNIPESISNELNLIKNAREEWSQVVMLKGDQNHPEINKISGKLYEKLALPAIKSITRQQGSIIFTTDNNWFTSLMNYFVPTTVTQEVVQQLSELAYMPTITDDHQIQKPIVYIINPSLARPYMKSIAIKFLARLPGPTDIKTKIGRHIPEKAATRLLDLMLMHVTD